MNSEKTIALVYCGGTNFGPPIGLVYLGSWVQARCPEWRVRIIDALHENPIHVLLTNRFDAIGISAMSKQFKQATEIARMLRVAKVNCPVIIGGFHVSMHPGSPTPDFDAVIRGEGEEQLASYLSTGCTSASIPDLDSYPDLDLGLLHPDYFVKRPLRQWYGSVSESILLTSRGCPYRCSFCSTSRFWMACRQHSVPWVINQMRRMSERGVTHIIIWDDLFTASKARLRKLAEAFEHAELHKVIKGIGCQSRANIIDREICDYLQRMNCKMINFGFESFNERVLKMLKVTGASVAMNKRAVRTVRKSGMMCVGSLMLGSPTETFREMLSTVYGIIWCTLNGVTDLWCYMTVPYPGTPLWDMAKERGVDKQIESDWDLLFIRSHIPGKPMLSDVPRWKFLVAWYLAQAALLPLKVVKLFRLLFK